MRKNCADKAEELLSLGHIVGMNKDLLLRRAVDKRVYDLGNKLIKSALCGERGSRERCGKGRVGNLIAYLLGILNIGIESVNKLTGELVKAINVDTVCKYTLRIGAGLHKNGCSASENGVCEHLTLNNRSYVIKGTVVVEEVTGVLAYAKTSYISLTGMKIFILYHVISSELFNYAELVKHPDEGKLHTACRAIKHNLTGVIVRLAGMVNTVLKVKGRNTEELNVLELSSKILIKALMHKE
jgi:hypothetical protein